MSLVKAFKRLWLFKRNPESWDSDKFRSNQEEATKKLHLSVEAPVQTGDPRLDGKPAEVGVQGRVLKKQTRRSPLVQTVQYQYKDGKVVTDRFGSPVLLDDVQPNESFLPDK